MAEIIHFPERHERQWNAMESCIRGQLRRLGTPTEMEDEICRNLSIFYEKTLLVKFNLDVKVPIPANANEDETRMLRAQVKDSFSELEKQIHEYTARILLERMILEIELYKLRHGLCI